MKAMFSVMLSLLSFAVIAQEPPPIPNPIKVSVFCSDIMVDPGEDYTVTVVLQNTTGAPEWTPFNVMSSYVGPTGFVDNAPIDMGLMTNRRLHMSGVSISIPTGSEYIPLSATRNGYAEYVTVDETTRRVSTGGPHIELGYNESLVYQFKFRCMTFITKDQEPIVVDPLPLQSPQPTTPTETAPK